MTQIKAVLLDFGLVLSGPPDPVAWELLKLTLGADEDAFHAAYWKHRNAYDQGLLTGRQYWHEVAAELGHEADDEIIAGLIAADVNLWTQPNQPMIDWVRQLHAAGIRTGILSNMGDAMEAGIITRWPWLSAFDHCTFSHQLKMVKPDERIYRHAAEALGVAPQQVLFIDDREENIAAARAVGMSAIHYCNHDSFLAELQPDRFELAQDAVAG